MVGKTTKQVKTKADTLDFRIATASKISDLLEKEFPDAKCELHYKTPEQLLFATILSAQCTDVRVNIVTPVLFEKYPTSKELAKAKQAQVEKIIYSTGFYRNKAKSLIATAKEIQKKYPTGLPKTIEQLTKLPGVGRKTANVLLGDAFNIQLGIVVDTHVKRLTQLIGLVEYSDPVKIEQELMKIVPQKIWTKFSHWLILHGRRTCSARKPNCRECVIKRLCQFGRNEDL